MYVIVKETDDDITYLEQATLNTFSTIDKAWITDDLELAIRIMIKIKKETYTPYFRIKVEPYKEEY